MGEGCCGNSGKPTNPQTAKPGQTGQPQQAKPQTQPSTKK